jgi:hypothetical protein
MREGKLKNHRGRERGSKYHGGREAVLLIVM